jgi:hypothetical protein
VRRWVSPQTRVSPPHTRTALGLRPRRWRLPPAGRERDLGLGSEPGWGSERTRGLARAALQLAEALLNRRPTLRTRQLEGPAKKEGHMVAKPRSSWVLPRKRQTCHAIHALADASLIDHTAPPKLPRSSADGSTACQHSVHEPTWSWYNIDYLLRPCSCDVGFHAYVALNHGCRWTAPGSPSLAVLASAGIDFSPRRRLPLL